MIRHNQPKLAIFIFAILGLLFFLALNSFAETTLEYTVTIDESPEQADSVNVKLLVNGNLEPNILPPSIPLLLLTGPPFSLASFSGQLEKDDILGTVASVSYSGDPQDLDGVILKATFSKGVRIIETDVPSQQANNEIIFDLMDAKYNDGQPGNEPIILEINAISNIELGNSRQTIVLDSYIQFPFIHPMFHEDDLSSFQLVDNNHTNDGYYAHDLCLEACGGDNEYMKGTPIYAPFPIQVLRIVKRAETGDVDNPHNYNIFIRNPYTGYHCLMSHVLPGNQLFDLIGDEDPDGFGTGWPVPTNTPIIQIDTNRAFAYVGPQDSESGCSHLHFECQTPYWPYGEVWDWTGMHNDPNIDNLCPSTSPCELTPSFETLDALLTGWEEPDLQLSSVMLSIPILLLD
jgi:hypothetical protein